MNYDLDCNFDFKGLLNLYNKEGIEFCVPKLKSVIYKTKSMMHAILVLGAIDRIKNEFAKNPELSSIILEFRPFVDDFLNIEISIFPHKMVENKYVYSSEISQLESFKKFKIALDKIFKEMFNNVSEFSFLGDITENNAFFINISSFDFDLFLKAFLNKKIYAATTKHLLELSLLNKLQDTEDRLIKV